MHVSLLDEARHMMQGKCCLVVAVTEMGRCFNDAQNDPNTGVIILTGAACIAQFPASADACKILQLERHYSCNINEHMGLVFGTKA